MGWPPGCVSKIWVSGRSLPRFWSYEGSKIAPSHWLDTSLIQQLVATAQAVIVNPNSLRPCHTIFRRRLKTFLFAQYWRRHSSALETFVPSRSINLLFTLFTLHTLGPAAGLLRSWRRHCVGCPSNLGAVFVSSITGDHIVSDWLQHGLCRVITTRVEIRYHSRADGDFISSIYAGDQHERHRISNRYCVRRFHGSMSSCQKPGSDRISVRQGLTFKRHMSLEAATMACSIYAIYRILLRLGDRCAWPQNCT